MQKSIFTLFIAVILSACGSNSTETGLILPENGKEIKLEQRSQKKIEGHNRNIIVHIGDITGGATHLTIKDGENILLSEKIAEGAIKDFEFDGHKYIIECTEQDNVLIGTDFAYFIVRNPTEKEQNETGMTEDEKIEKLIGIVASSDVIFIRNGDEYPADEAADHLRTKWESSQDEIKTLDDFIEHIASYSSTTGEPYQIKTADTTVSANSWMKEQVKYF